MNPVFTYAGSLLTSCFYILIMHKLMKAFFSRPSGNQLRFVVWTVYYILQAAPILGVVISPPIMFFLNMALVLIISSISYDAGVKRRCIFSVLVCAVWMLMEVSTDIILRLAGVDGWELQTAGTIISLMLMYLLAVTAGHYVRRTEQRDIPFRYVVAVLTVPAGSAYLMHNIFLITAQHEEYTSFAIISGLLLLLLIYMIFEVYDRMMDDAEAQEKNLLYEQELDLLNRHAQEREAYDTEMRRLRHDMKHHMSSLLGMLQGNNAKQAEKYVREMLQETPECRAEDVSRTGNAIVDSLVNHKCGIARAEGIAFDANVFLPAELPFLGGHLTIVFGNLLDNALEACREVEVGKRYVTLGASYEKEVLMIAVKNPYRGERRKNRAGKYITTKKDRRSHGVGLSSVEQAVEAYCGQVDTDEQDGVFRVSVVMYGGEGKNDADTRIYYEQQRENGKRYILKCSKK